MCYSYSVDQWKFMMILLVGRQVSILVHQDIYTIISWRRLCGHVRSTRLIITVCTAAIRAKFCAKFVKFVCAFMANGICADQWCATDSHQHRNVFTMSVQWLHNITDNQHLTGRLFVWKQNGITLLNNVCVSTYVYLYTDRSDETSYLDVY